MMGRTGGTGRWRPPLFAATRREDPPKKAKNPGPKTAKNPEPKTRPTHEEENEGKQMEHNNDSARFTLVFTDDLFILKGQHAIAQSGKGTFGGLEAATDAVLYSIYAGNKNINAELTRALDNLLRKFGSSTKLLAFLRGCYFAFDNDVTMPTETEIMVRLGLRKPYEARHLSPSQGGLEVDLSSQTN